MRNNLDIGLLWAMQAFIRVIDSGSFTHAAEQMDLTTAQVSRLVADLERRLGIKLLQRTTRRHLLTDGGAAYAERCRELLGLVDEAEAQARGAGARPRGRLRLQCMTNFGQHYVAPVLADFCAAYPDLTVDYSTSQYVPDLLARGADVSLYLAESLHDSGVVARRLGATFAVLCAAPDYLARHGTPAGPDQLRDHACLRLVNPSVSGDWRVLDVAADGAIRTLAVRGQLVADTPDMVLDATLRGAGITLLPLFSVIDAVRAGRLVHILPGWRSPAINVYALLPSRHFMDARTRAWLDWVDMHIVPRLEADTAYFS
jgi:DNA-binding transcriptional LysR family regulator